MQTFVYANRAMILDTPYYRNRRDNPNSSVKDTGKVYCMNVEYDYIENLLKSDERIWDTFKFMFWLKRYDNYMFTMNRIDESFIPEYVLRFQEDFLRAKKQGELAEDVFTERQWSNIGRILDDPQA